jgi:NAD(P)-dependent dehydrogenase (short-subunit alcohol dehydrogenase family)
MRFGVYMWQRQSPLAWIPVANYTGTATASRIALRKLPIWPGSSEFPSRSIAIGYGQLQEKLKLAVAHAYPCDVVDSDSCVSWFGTIAADVAPVDVLINNAAGER